MDNNETPTATAKRLTARRKFLEAKQRLGRLTDAAEIEELAHAPVFSPDPTNLDDDSPGGFLVTVRPPEDERAFERMFGDLNRRGVALFEKEQSEAGAGDGL